MCLVIGAHEELKDDDVKIEKAFILGKKMKESVVHVNFDHWQYSNLHHSDSEKHNGIDRRNGILFVNFDRRQNNNYHYNGPERRSGIERRNGFSADSSQKERRL